jgi:transposase-like protein
MIDFSHFDSLIAIAEYFNTKERCVRAIRDSRWGDGDVVCPYCGGHHCVERKDGRYRCNHCKRNFSVLVGTIFENTKISLVKWISGFQHDISGRQSASHISSQRDYILRLFSLCLLSVI